LWPRRKRGEAESPLKRDGKIGFGIDRNRKYRHGSSGAQYARDCIGKEKTTQINTARLSRACRPISAGGMSG